MWYFYTSIAYSAVSTILSVFYVYKTNADIKYLSLIVRYLRISKEPGNKKITEALSNQNFTADELDVLETLGYL
jgi:hypothetical protein